MTSQSLDDALSGGNMVTTIGRLHRILVDRLAETRWLRNRAGAQASWAHYERHAKAWRSAQERHARARRSASARHARVHGAARQAADRGRDRRAPRTLRSSQADIGRITARQPRAGGDAQ